MQRYHNPRRVVVTGVGLVTPLGCKVEQVWQQLISGISGIQSIYDEKYSSRLQLPSGCNVNVAGFIPYPEFEENFKPNSKELSLVTQYGLWAAKEALNNSNLLENGKLTKDIDTYRMGVNLGSGGIGPLLDIIDGQENLKQSYKKLSPYFVTKVLMNMPSSQISIQYGLKGPIHAVGTACASGVHSIGDAFNFIQLNYADVMLTGGTEACISPLAIAGFHRMKALSSRESKEGPSRPFDASRDGFVMGEGAGVVILEELHHAQHRNAPILAEVISYAISGDAYHISSPASSNHGGAFRGMKMVMERVGVSPDEIGYINAHSTSTLLGDTIESDAIDLVFESKTRILSQPLYVSSNKGSIGHLLGAAGAVESIFTIQSLKSGILPPTIHLENPHPIPKSFHHIPNNSISHPNLKYAIKNSFGFGGVNGVLLFKKYEV